MATKDKPAFFPLTTARAMGPVRTSEMAQRLTVDVAPGEGASTAAAIPSYRMSASGEKIVRPPRAMRFSNFY